MSRYRHRYGRHKADRPEDLFLFLIAILIVGIFSPTIGSIITRLWYVYAFAIVIIGIIIGGKIYHQYRLSKAGIYEVDKMSGTDFEMFLSSLFSKLGYKVKHTGETGDFGSDLILEMDGVKIAVQAKRYKENVGPDAVREVNTVLKPRNCTLGMVVTNSFFTNEAKFLAKENNIALWDRNELVNNILKSQEKVNPSGGVLPSTEIPSCPKCHSSMVIRLGKYGQFWGCSRYPSCEGAISIVT